MWRIPLSDLDYDESEQEAVAGVLRSRWLSMGPRTEEFEARVAEYLQVRHAIAVANGTCALEMACQVLIDRAREGERPDAGAAAPEVLVPDLTFVATANAALFSGARVRFADLESLTEPILRTEDAARFAEPGRIPGVSRIVAPVHYAGFDARSDEVAALARSCGARVVEDAAHAIGGRSRSGRFLGTTGDVGCFSFFANKNLATGEGGLVVTQDDALAERLRLLRSHGMTSLTWKRHSTRGHGYDVLRPGHNYRITEITAALALVQLAKLEAGNARRRRLYRLYRDAFRMSERLRVPFGDEDEAIERSSCHIFPLLCASPALRDRVRASLNEAGIQTSHHYPPVHTFSFYRELAAREGGSTAGEDPAPETLGQEFPSPDVIRRERFPFPAAVHYAAREITLPLHPGLKEVELEEVVSIVLRTVAQN